MQCKIVQNVEFRSPEVVKALKKRDENPDKRMATQGDNFVINELIREYLEWNGCGNAAAVLVGRRRILGAFISTTFKTILENHSGPFKDLKSDSRLPRPATRPPEWTGSNWNRCSGWSAARTRGRCRSSTACWPRSGRWETRTFEAAFLKKSSVVK